MARSHKGHDEGEGNTGIIGPALQQAQFAGGIAEILENPGAYDGGQCCAKNQKGGALRREAAQHDVTVPAIPEYLTRI